MLWEYINRFKVSISLTFCILFSIINIIWQKNLVSNSTIYLNKLIEQSNYFFKNIFNLPFTVIDRIYEYSQLKQQYQKTLEEIEKYKLQKEQYEILLKENEKLRQLLNFESFPTYEEVKAEVLGIRLNSITPRIIINKGKKHGLKPFMPVLTFTHDENNIPIRTVVGIISIVLNTSSIVQPLQHPQMKIGVKILNTNQWAILEGDSHSLRSLQLKYITSSSSNDSKFFNDPYLEIKDSRVVTSGNDGIFPKNIPIGKISNKSVSNVNYYNIAYVEPYVDLDKLEYVIVLLKEPEPWKKFIDSEEKDLKDNSDLNLSEYIPEDLIKDYSSNKKNIDNLTKQAIKQKNDEVSSIENKSVKIEEKDKNNIRIINPNDPLQQ